MTWKNLRALAAAAMLATGLIGFAAGQWASADPSGPPRKPAAPTLPPVPVEAAKPARAGDAEPGTARRREAVIRMPVGTFVKEFEAQPYGSGRITWTYEEDRVLGLIEASVMGAEVELATEAEISMSRNGTIYGLLTSVRVSRLHIPETEEFAMLKPYAGFWPLLEPVVAEMTTDLPFSYQVRASGDRLSIHNFRMLLAGPNPLGKLGGALGVEGGVGTALAGFSALGVAVEGSYTATDAKEQKEAPKSRPAFKKPTGHTAPPAPSHIPAAAPSKGVRAAPLPGARVPTTLPPSPVAPAYGPPPRAD